VQGSAAKTEPIVATARRVARLHRHVVHEHAPVERPRRCAALDLGDLRIPHGMVRRESHHAAWDTVRWCALRAVPCRATRRRCPQRMPAWSAHRRAFAFAAPTAASMIGSAIARCTCTSGRRRRSLRIAD
jgi:hypothetical protein